MGASDTTMKYKDPSLTILYNEGQEPVICFSEEQLVAILKKHPNYNKHIVQKLKNPCFPPSFYISSGTNVVLQR